MLPLYKGFGHCYFSPLFCPVRGSIKGDLYGCPQILYPFFAGLFKMSNNKTAGDLCTLSIIAQIDQLVYAPFYKNGGKVCREFCFLRDNFLNELKQLEMAPNVGKADCQNVKFGAGVKMTKKRAKIRSLGSGPF